MYNNDERSGGSLIASLSKASERRFSNPYAEFEWPARLEQDQYYFSPELISLYGTDQYQNMSEIDRKRLSFWECINFFSLNIHGEKALLSSLVSNLYHKKWDAEIFEYLHHFIDEENKHMSLFGRFCERYAGKTYMDKKLVMQNEYSEGQEDFLFFAKVVIFEEIVDHFNVQMAQDTRLDPFIRSLHDYHHHDELRHLAFGRRITQHLFEKYSPQWDASELGRVRNYLENYLRATWREYYNPDMYTDAGIDNAYEQYQIAMQGEYAKNLRNKVSRNCLNYFVESEILLDYIEL